MSAPIWIHVAINLASTALLAHTIVSWRVAERRHQAYKRRGALLLHMLACTRTVHSARVIAAVFDANHEAWGEAIRKPWWRRDPIDEER